MATLTLKIEGKLPKGVRPKTLRVEPEKGTYVLLDSKGERVGGNQLGSRA